MRKIVASLLMSIPGLLNVGIFFTFFYVIFGIMGLHQFSGALYGRCRTTKEPVGDTWELFDHPDMARPCSNSGMFTRKCPKGSFCGNWYDKGR